MTKGVGCVYQALYRKYRPQTFSDVVGQKGVTDTLRAQLETGKLSHAYLFTGVRGTGKTSCAKILAKAVNCLDPQDGNPCAHSARRRNLYAQRGQKARVHHRRGTHAVHRGV